MEIAMLKVQTAIKWVITFICITSFSQNKISGVYSPLMPLQEYYKTFEFNKNGEFVYRYGASLGDDEYGKGHYTVKNDSLFLNYDLTKLIYDNYYKSKKWKNYNDSNILKFTVKTFDGQLLEGVNIIAVNNKLGVKTDQIGKGEINIPKSENNIEFVISLLGFKTSKIILSSGFNYDLEVFLQENKTRGYPIYGELKKFRIIEYEIDYLLLEDMNGKKVKWVKIKR